MTDPAPTLWQDCVAILIGLMMLPWIVMAVFYYMEWIMKIIHRWFEK